MPDLRTWGLPWPFNNPDNLIREIPPSKSLSKSQNVEPAGDTTQRNGDGGKRKGDGRERDKNKKTFTTGYDTICS